MQAAAEAGDRFEERQVARLERTMGVSVAWIVHIYLYVAHTVWDTDTNPLGYDVCRQAARHNTFPPRSFRCREKVLMNKARSLLYFLAA